MNITPLTMNRLIHEDVGLQTYKRYIHHLLTEKLKVIRSESSQKLLEKYEQDIEEGDYRNFLFTDEKTFTVEEGYNKQNNRMYAHSYFKACEKIPAV